MSENKRKNDLDTEKSPKKQKVSNSNDENSFEQLIIEPDIDLEIFKDLSNVIDDKNKSFKFEDNDIENNQIEDNQNENNQIEDNQNENNQIEDNQNENNSTEINYEEYDQKLNQDLINNDETSVQNKNLDYLNSINEQIYSLILNLSQSKNELKKMDKVYSSIRNTTLFNEFDMMNRKKLESNFSSLLNIVLNEYSYLFDEDEKNLFEKFNHLSQMARTLFLLLLLKRERWFFKKSIEFFERQNLDSLLEELKDIKLLMDSNSLTSLEEGLHILDKEEVNNISKDLKLKKINKSKTKNIEEIISYAKKSTRIDKDNKSLISLELTELKKIKESLTGKCFKLNRDCLISFFKVLLIYFEPLEFNKEVYFNYEKLIINSSISNYSENFKNYTINQTRTVYDLPDDLSNFAQSCLFEIDLSNERYVNLNVFLLDVLIFYQKYVNLKLETDLKLPFYLRNLTAGKRICNVLTKIVELNSRSDLNDKILMLIDKYQDHKDIVYEDQLQIDSIHIETAEKTTEKIMDDIIKDYKRKGFDENLVEPEFFKNLFFILFKDQIYAQDINDTFLFRFQKYPLDLESSEFYSNRRTAFDKRITELSEMRMKDIVDLVKNQKDKWLKSTCKPIKFEKLKELLYCFDVKTLISIIEHLAKDYSTIKAKSPNLIRYDEAERKCELLRVKPVDLNLTNEEISWLNFLSSKKLDVKIINYKSVIKS